MEGKENGDCPPTIFGLKVALKDSDDRCIHLDQGCPTYGPRARTHRRFHPAREAYEAY